MSVSFLPVLPFSASRAWPLPWSGPGSATFPPLTCSPGPIASLLEAPTVHQRTCLLRGHFKPSWTAIFSYRFASSKQINLLELGSLISLFRRITREGVQARRVLVLVVLGAVSKGRSSSRKVNFLLRKLVSGFFPSTSR